MTNTNKLKEYYDILYREFNNPSSFIEFTEEEAKQEAIKEERRFKLNEYMKARQKRLVREKYGLPPNAKLPKRKLTEEHKAKIIRKPKGVNKNDNSTKI